MQFDAALSTIDTSTVLRLPATASRKLPSRGQVAVHGTINGVEFRRCSNQTEILATG